MYSIDSYHEQVAIMDRNNKYHQQKLTETFRNRLIIARDLESRFNRLINTISRSVLTCFVTG